MGRGDPCFENTGGCDRDRTRAQASSCDPLGVAALTEAGVQRCRVLGKGTREAGRTLLLLALRGNGRGVRARVACCREVLPSR